MPASAPYIFRKVWTPFSVALTGVDSIGKKAMGAANRTIGKISKTVSKTMKGGKKRSRRHTKKSITRRR
jgi:hypothetical protein